MRLHSKTRSHGLTLAEWILILVILSILVGVVLPAFTGRFCGRAKASDVRCLGTARAISTIIRAYAMSWNGWTHPDPDFYVKLMGYPLMNECPPVGRYNADAAKLVKDFRCPLDHSRRLNRHGYYSSYCSLLSERNLFDIQTPGETPEVVEVGRRHIVPGTEQTSFSVVFADGSSRLAMPADAIDAPQVCAAPGIPCITWYSTAPAGLFDVLKVRPDIDFSNATVQTAKRITSRALTSGCLSHDLDDWAWVAEDWKDPDGKKQVIVSAGHEMPANCVIRWEGYWEFPQDGANPKSAIRLLADWFDLGKGWLWLDLNDNNVIEPKETLHDQRVALEANRKYRLVVMWYNDNSNFCRARVVWHYDRPGETNNWRPLSYAECYHEPGATYFPPLVIPDPGILRGPGPLQGHK